MGLLDNLGKLGGVFGLAGSLIGGNSAKAAQESANRTNIQLQQKQLDWEERMSNSAWQRATKDMLASGINPMLAVSQGGASTPNVSAATVIPEDGMARGISSAADKMMQMASLALINAQARGANEDANQKEIITEDMKNQRGLTGGRATFWENIANESNRIKSDSERAKFLRDVAEIEARIRLDDEGIRKVERAIIEETQGFNVASAAARAKILDQEVDMNEIRKILMRLDIPEKEAIAKWFEMVGAGSPATKAVMSIGQWLKFILSGRGN